MINALLDKIFLRLQIVYDNFLKFFKILKKIKVYFTHVNNCHKITRKTYEKKKIQKVDKSAHLFTTKKFVLFFSQSIYTF